ncbi:MAG: hypothetical protein H0W66_03015 [Chthoniobacterales bacterium]|nr:hypothetical protein [Chthoniobacterales bacterium]
MTVPMMGWHARQNELWSEPVNLARRIPADHPLRKLKETIKLEFVRGRGRGELWAQGECLGRSGDCDENDAAALLGQRAQ